MEICLLVLLFIPYLILKYYLTDHDTKAEKDYNRFAEGIALFRRKSFEDAFVYFDQQVKLYPKSAIAYAYRGKCNLLDENYYSALYDLTQALSFDNTLAECYIDKGKVHMALLEFKDAFREFDKAVWFFRNENAEALRLRGLARLRMQQIVQSERDFIRAVELGDEDSRFILSQAPFYKAKFTY
jgi:tetratricopeptide (TPR) repeat protein